VVVLASKFSIFPAAYSSLMSLIHLLKPNKEEKLGNKRTKQEVWENKKVQFWPALELESFYGI